ncbi:MAG TPA: DUF4382 domain-containing protein [Anaeromyxobacter sp.]
MNRSLPRTLAGAGATLALALLAACQSSPAGTALMNVHLVDGPALEYSALNLHVVRVEISKDGAGWITLGTPDVTVNLLSLTGGVAETLVDGASIPAGTYGQMRLVLGEGNTITTPDGTFPLKVPSGMQSGVKLDVHFDVAADTTKDVFIDFDAHRSVFVHEAGASEQYILRPVVRAFDKIVTGAVKGTLTDAATAAPLPGVEVMAETLDGTGKAAVARSTTTATDGTYVLDLLPVGGAYFVVAQPRVATVAYAAGAAGPFAVTEATPVLTSDLAFAKVDAPGGLAGTITPLPGTDQTDEVTLLGTVPVATVDHTFVLRGTTGVASTTAETWAIDLLPAGAYSLFVTRATADTTGGLTYATGPAASATVAAGATTSGVTLTAP